MALKLKTKSSLKKDTKPKTAKKVIGGIDAATELLPEAFKYKKELAVLEAQSSAITKKLSPIEAQIKKHVETELDGTESVDLINGALVLNVSGKMQTRVIKDVEAVVDACEEFEEGLALKIAKFSLGDLDKYFSPAEMEVLVEIKEGSRRLKYK